MFTFGDGVPLNIRDFLVTLLQAWIDRRDLPKFSVETTRYGLVTFRREPWPYNGTDDIMVFPDKEVDIAALAAYSEEIASQQ